MVEKFGRGFGAAIAVLLAVSCLFIGKVVAVDSPHSPVGILVRMAQNGLEPAASDNLRASAADRQQDSGGLSQRADAAPTPPAALQALQQASDGPALTPEANRPLASVVQGAELTGRVAVFDPVSRIRRPAERMRLALLQGGQIVADFRSLDNGTFAVGGLNPGPYSLVGIGQDGYVAFGVELQDDPTVGAHEAAQSGDVAAEQLLQSRELEILAVPPVDAPLVLSIAQRHLPAGLTTRGSTAAGPANEPGEAPQQAIGEEVAPEGPAGAVFAQAEPAEEVPQNDPHVSHDVIAVNAPPTEVQLASDLSLSGSILIPGVPAGQQPALREMSVFLVHEGQIVGSAPVSAEGGFTFGSVAPGVYSFVAAGADGFAAFSVRVITGSVAESERADALSVPVSHVQAGFPGLVATLVMVEDVSFAIAQLAAATSGPDAPLATPVGPWGAGPVPFGPAGFGPGGFAGGGGYGGAGGFGGGGGYGFFGGEGLGTALGLAALGVGIAALVIAEDDDDVRIIATPF